MNFYIYLQNNPQNLRWPPCYRTYHSIWLISLINHKYVDIGIKLQVFVSTTYM
jgi:hypothetical protein